jgi:hypothetical protein
VLMALAGLWETRKAGSLTFENDCGRETDCTLEGMRFEPSVPLDYRR